MQFAKMALLCSIQVKNLEAVRQNGLALQYLPHSLRDRFDIVAAAVRQNSSSFPFTSKRLQNDYQIIEFARGTKIILPMLSIGFQKHSYNIIAR
ncbi:MAG: DUF4116 domain-containing protein [Chlamydiales bacterium]